MTNPGHELLTKGEFKARLVTLGYDNRTAGKLFGTLVRSTLWSDNPRSASDIGYWETTKGGEQELLLSVPNLSAQLDNLQSIHEIGETSVEICRHLIEASASADPSDS